VVKLVPETADIEFAKATSPDLRETKRLGNAKAGKRKDTWTSAVLGMDASKEIQKKFVS
jgi:hypothetical protein